MSVLRPSSRMLRFAFGLSCSLALLVACGSDSEEGGPPTNPNDGQPEFVPDPPGGAPRLADRSSLLPPSTTSTVDVLAFDIDGDGDKDIVWVGQDFPLTGTPTSTGTIEVSINDGGKFTAGDLGVAIEEMGGFFQFGRAADVDKDGDIDLVLTRAARQKPEVMLLLNDGKGKFTKGDVPEITGESDGLIFGRVAIGDLDKDGDLDIFVPIFSNVAIDGDRPNILLLNDGKGSFTRDSGNNLPTIPKFEDYTLSVAIGDVNKDGAPDVFLGESEDQQRLLINDGSGKLVDQTENDGSGKRRLDQLKLRAFRSEMFDIDADGDLDIVIVNDTTETSSNPKDAVALFNDGSGHFATGKLPGVPGNTYALGFGDLNSDKLPDLVVGHSKEPSHGGKAVEFLLGAGGGKFKEMPVTGLGPWQVGVYGIVVEDFNGDGIGDVAAAVGEPDASGGMKNLLFLSELAPR